MMAPSVEDRLSIEDLFTRYMWALDSGDIDGILDCFTEDGALESPTIGRHEGRETGVRAFATRFAALPAKGVQLRHMICNILSDMDGEEANARCYLAVFVTRDGQSRLLGPGQYDCRLRREGGRWRFQTRRVTMDHAYAIEGL